MSKVLVVDDEKNQCRALAIGLRLEGFEVVTANDGDEALHKLEGEPVDVAIVDLMLPGTNGLDLARLLRSRYPETRVLLTSAYHLSERQLLKSDCGIIAFVPKPCQLTELASFLRTKLHSSPESCRAKAAVRLPLPRSGIYETVAQQEEDAAPAALARAVKR